MKHSTTSNVASVRQDVNTLKELVCTFSQANKGPWTTLQKSTLLTSIYDSYPHTLDILPGSGFAIRTYIHGINSNTIPPSRPQACPYAPGTLKRLQATVNQQKIPAGMMT